MLAGLVYATRWDHVDGEWLCKLLIDGEPSKLVLRMGEQIAFKVEKGRFCVGHSKITRDYSASDLWKERVPCPTSSPTESGNQCRLCASRDASSPCARCTGESCTAHPSVREACEGNEAYVYLAVFGDRVKAGVSQGRRVEKRWIEQGADAARRVLTGNGFEVRFYEKKIQDELGALRHVTAREKMSFTDPKELEKGLRNLDEYIEAIRSLLPSASRVQEEPTLLSRIYKLPPVKNFPIEIRIRDNTAISGKIWGVKGPILFLEEAGTTHSVNLNSLTGRKISEDLTGSRPSQSGLGKYVKN